MQERNTIYGRLTQAFVNFAGEVCTRTLQQGITALEGMAARAAAASEQARYRADAEALRAAQATVQQRFVRRLQDKFRRFATGEELSDQETLGAQPDEWASELSRAVDGVTNAVAAPLWHLNMRMALLRGGYKTTDYSNPLGPGQFFGALAWALADQALPLRVQLLLCR